MAAPSTPSNPYLNQGNQTITLGWDLNPIATSYTINRSSDGVTYTVLATPTTNSYVDSTVTLGTMYYYTIQTTNGSGTSLPTAPLQMVAAPNGEMSLYELRLRSQQRADRVNSQFVTTSEWNYFIQNAMYELYDLLIDVYEDYFEAPEIVFYTSGNQYQYPLPDGKLTFINSANNTSIVAPPFYKLSGLDLGINNANNAYVTINKYNLIDRNKYVYPNTASTIYGVFNLQYRLLGNNIRFIPTPSNAQPIRILYIPRLPQLLQDTDLTNIGFCGWLQYVICRAAKYALAKEESDTTEIDNELIFLKGRIEESAMNRDAGQADTISDTRGFPWGSGPFNGLKGGW